ncbi:precorrin-6y C5,15-methyltransferase (decarboxylating) subunit CbiE [Mediterraneibacter sp. 210702-DFI.5.30]|uniref:precorrin-6y C5,15-methyltransferase (decarboxylating) subunit CbiE n=1 Tax=Mediterraneibacter sp. 210702-DFI.5.30 TaxID=2883232 RepID=UPI001D064E03|nr:precorrin-6y C5,15-methyltransferase (decarboxylating) subunit CbiE [Mediterraneibacter sp. 210702-DFI.5.30]MCB6621680.1 precorrin-6y C5,15-methyltransferase (decarboxylating) subunit CbiE [Mediterraneibacter sp. 210702-DFI.5.30]
MESRQIILAGIGMGSKELITAEVRKLIEEADCLIGAERMLACAIKLRNSEEKCTRECTKYQEYRTEKIISYLQKHKEYKQIVILLSGDTGFYSGAKNLRNQLLEKLSLVEEKKIKILPGISSLSYLASKVGVSWEDAKILSLHGKDMNFVQTIHRHSKTFLLLGGKDTGRHFYETLLEYGLGDVQVHVGCQMSYEEEKILSGKLYEMKAEDFEGLCAVLVENSSYCKAAGMHLKDEAFIRGKVPMTKSEVRSVSIAELELTEDAIVYDIGAGTGSVSIEIARAGEQIRVYAIEKNPEGVELIDQNRKKFRTDGVRIIEGLAPHALEELETPTHAFIGGSSGNLREIVQLLQRKNPDVRIVINAISLETVSEVMGLVDEGVLPDAEILQVSAARSKVLGRYHMMMGQNPVYIISADGRKPGQV